MVSELSLVLHVIAPRMPVLSMRFRIRGFRDVTLCIWVSTFHRCTELYFLQD